MNTDLIGARLLTDQHQRHHSVCNWPQNSPRIFNIGPDRMPKGQGLPAGEGHLWEGFLWWLLGRAAHSPHCERHKMSYWGYGWGSNLNLTAWGRTSRGEAGLWRSPTSQKAAGSLASQGFLSIQAQHPPPLPVPREGLAASTRVKVTK